MCFLDETHVNNCVCVFFCPNINTESVWSETIINQNPGDVYTGWPTTKTQLYREYKKQL